MKSGKKRVHPHHVSGSVIRRHKITGTIGTVHSRSILRAHTLRITIDTTGNTAYFAIENGRKRAKKRPKVRQNEQTGE